MDDDAGLVVIGSLEVDDDAHVAGPGEFVFHWSPVVVAAGDLAVREVLEHFGGLCGGSAWYLPVSMSPNGDAYPRG